MRSGPPLYVRVLIGIVLGIALGYFFPKFGASLQPIADGFVKLIKMLLAPIIFGTVVTGIAGMGNIREVGRIGVKALVYFELVSTLALAIGLLVINLLHPGQGMNIAVSGMDAGSIAAYTGAAKAQGGPVAFLMDIIPTTLVDAFARGAMLQVILISILFGVALTGMGARAKPLLDVIEALLKALFAIVNMVMRLAPLAAGAGMAFTIGKYGAGILLSLGQLIFAVYLAAAIFVFLVLGVILRLAGLSLLRFLRYIGDEILITAGTCSTEAVLPAMLEKLERLGCQKAVVGMVLPAGYTFNADGTCLYLTGAAIFIAQATNTPLPLMDQLGLMAVLLLTSKGSAGVAGAGFVTLAATLSTLHTLPVVGLVLLLGVDRFLNVARAVTNLIGNGVATIIVARWDGAFDKVRALETL
jgi:aerobic C4-dicarboxylate transport protein